MSSSSPPTPKSKSKSKSKTAHESQKLQGVTSREIFRVGDSSPHPDELAVEEPLEIRLAGDTLATTMRTPGEDLKLVAGFLLAEGLIRSLDDLGSIQHCGRPGTEGFGNVVDAIPAPGVVIDVEKMQARRRGTLTTSACGVCGRQSIDDLLAVCRPLPDGPIVPRARMGDALAQLRQGQTIFDRTGGTHAVAAFASSGERLACHEDVGRHNAVDKVVGALLYQHRIGEPRDETLPSAVLLAVSGRASFEIVQKAAVAGIPIVASVSAPSSLAVDLAKQLGITLAGFVRGESFNLYSHRERVL
jgi:FdhD protein